MNNDMIRNITTSVLAVMIFAATLYVVITNPTNAALPLLTALCGAAGGVYFTHSTQASTVSSILKAQDKPGV